MSFHRILAKYRTIVDDQLDHYFLSLGSVHDKYLSYNQKQLHDFVLRPGKRLRPIATIMAFRAIKDQHEKRVYPISIVPELFHTSSLIHDDIMDEDRTRRGKPTVHELQRTFHKKNQGTKKYTGSVFSSTTDRFGISQAVLQGNVLFSCAYDCIMQSKLTDKQKIFSLKLFTEAYQFTNFGQMLDIQMGASKTAKETTYLSMVDQKTAHPLAASLVFGAYLNNASSKVTRAFSQYGHLIGQAFQIHDDILDITSKQKGRSLGSDIRQGAKTLLLLKTMISVGKMEKNYLKKVVGNPKATVSQIKKVQRIIRDSGAIDYAQKVCAQNVQKAQTIIANMPIEAVSKRFFSDLADYTIKREK